LYFNDIYCHSYNDYAVYGSYRFLDNFNYCNIDLDWSDSISHIFNFEE
jgi:hypothetical protein